MAFIMNPSFETRPTFVAATNTGSVWIDGTAAGSGTNDTYGWGTRTITGSGSAQFDTSTFNSGTGSLKVSTTAIASQIDVSNNKATAPAGQNIIPAIEGVTYTLTCWAKSTAVSGSATTGARVSLAPRTAAGASAGTSSVIAIGPATTGWTQYKTTLLAPPTTQFIYIFCTVLGSDGTGTLIMDAWFDDFVLIGNSAFPNNRLRPHPFSPGLAR